MSPKESHPPELDDAEEAIEASNFDDAIEGAKSFLNADRLSVRQRAKRLTGLAHYHKGEYQEAVPYLRAVAESEESTDAWFNLATSATQAEEVSTGLEAFRRATDLNDSDRLALPQMHFNFAKALVDISEYERALERLNWLGGAYAELGITDDTFLRLRGVPFLSKTLELAVEVFTELDRGADGRTWMDSLASEVDDRGSEEIDQFRQELS